MSDADHAIVAGTARVVVGLYFLAVLVGVGRRRRCGSLLSLRLWTAACVLLMVHFVAAFQWAHHWSLAEAETHTTQETIRVVGRSFGVELSVNFLFAIWWAVDCVARWRARFQQRPISRSYNAVVQLAWGFMFVNATVVFGPPFWRWLIVPAVLLVLIKWGRTRCWPDENHEHQG